MIGFLSGILKSHSGHSIILDVHGVGYKVLVYKTQNLIPGDKLELFIHTHVREDDISLFGFQKESDLQIFELLLTVSGIGPKSAQNIMSGVSGDLIKKAIESSNINFFTSISGVGKKSAQRIIIELRPKLTSAATSMSDLEGNPALVDALRELGFKNLEITPVLSQIDKDEPLPNQLRTALKLLHR